jgi:hypothetical protein
MSGLLLKQALKDISDLWHRTNFLSRAVCNQIDSLENFMTCSANLTGLLQREWARDPGPAAFVSLCAVFTLCLAHFIQHNSKHRYQNSFMVCGAVSGLVLGMLTARQETILINVFTAYLPVSIITAQLLSLILHTMLLAWQNPDPCRHGNIDRQHISDTRKLASVDDGAWS